jgi:dipicolinate synthase subunit A
MTDGIKTIGIIGGDKRQLYLADSFVKDGFRVILGGFDSLKSVGDIAITDVKSALNYSDIIIFPLPSVRTDGSVNAPFSQGSIYLSDEDVELIRSKPVFLSFRERFLRAYPKLGSSPVFDYASREDFAVLNAVPTAEGAIECAMCAYEGTIAGSKSLVTGFGRIGKILARKLCSLGSDVTVSARRFEDLAYINALGYNAENTEELKKICGYDLVFNTVPALIFDEALLKNTDRDTLIIDLASAPGGVDFEAARSLKIDAQRALSLPGKCSPKAAAEIIKQTVTSIIKEVNW